MYQNSNEKKDSEKIQRKNAILQQINTKTVGPPLASTGLVGDQAPATVFTVDDFDQISKQVHTQQENELALEMLNSIGRITGTQSSSGPIAGTQFVSQTAATSAGDVVIYAPTADKGVWQLTAASVGTISSGTSNILLLLNDVETTSSVLLENVGAAQTQFDLNEPIYVSYPCRIVANLDAYSSGTTTIRVSLIRVR